MRRLMIALTACGAVGLGACAWAADVAVVKTTIAVKNNPVLARGFAGHTEAVTRKLAQSGVPFDTLTDEQVIAGRLSGYKLAVFPYSSIRDSEEIRRILDFVRGGGKLLWFYSFPRELGPVLGIERCESRKTSAEGDLFTMKFAADRPAGFPAEVHQQSPNCRAAEKIAADSRAIALWHDKAGRSTGVPAVILSPRSVWVAHVLWSDANADQQTQLLVASIGHFLPEKWTELVDAALAKAGPEAGYDDLPALCRAAKTPAAKQWAARASAEAGQARNCLAAKRLGEALSLAGQARVSAQQAAAAMFPSRPYELRGAWIHPNDSTDWEATMARLAAARFNAVFPIMCGPGSANYKSDFAPQVTRRDHMRECLDAARRHGIEVHVWKANWQVLSNSPERSALFTKEDRFVKSLEQAAGKPEKSSYQWSTRWLDPSDERNRQLEYDMMMELVRKYHPAGIHFDFMRYPESGYCFCPPCRTKFQQWAGVEVAHWPDDCAGKGPQAERFRQWRRHLQTSLVKRIAEGARRIDPNVKLSLAARASMTGSYESDAQDWVTWSKEGYLDFLCPMDYTDRLDVLRAKLRPQVAAVGGAVPVYAGLGVSPTRSATPVNLCQQIRLARELGADGFLVFALSPFSEAMLPAVGLGPTSAPVTVMPHHKQPVKARFDYAPGVQAELPRTYRAGVAPTIPVRLTGISGVQRLTAAALRQQAAGGPEEAIGREAKSEGPALTLSVPLSDRPGVVVIVVRGVATTAEGEKPYYLRSLAMRIATEEEIKALAAEKDRPPASRRRP